MIRGLVLALAASACVHTEFVKQPEPRPCSEAPVAAAQEPPARVALRRFVEAVERRDFEAAYALLDGALRRRYSPQRLEQDLALEPRGTGLVSRAKAALEAPVIVEGDRATIAVAEGRAASLVKEADGWRVSSLDATR